MKLLFRTINTADYTLQLIQQYISDAFNTLANNPTLTGNLLKSVSLKASQDNLISHGLQRNYLGFFLCTPNGFGSVALSPTANQLTDKQIILVASVDLTTDLYIF